MIGKCAFTVCQEFDVLIPISTVAVQVGANSFCAVETLTAPIGFSWAAISDNSIALEEKDRTYWLFDIHCDNLEWQQPLHCDINNH